MGFEQCLWSFDDNKVWNNNWIINVCSSMQHHVIKFLFLSQVFVLKHQDSERIRKHLKQKRSLYDMNQDMKNGQSESQLSDQKRLFT